MRTPVNSAGREGFAHPRLGLGRFLILAGSVLVALGAVFAFSCSPIFHDACSSFAAVALFVAGLGLTLVIFGLPLVYTRWQFSRKLAFCPSCGANTGRDDTLCPRCGNRL